MLTSTSTFIATTSASMLLKRSGISLGERCSRMMF